jgi:hypothetical protein
MAALTKFVHELCSDEPGATNYNDFHTIPLNLSPASGGQCV